MRRYDANGQPLVDENGRERWFELGMKSLEDIHARLFDDVDAAEVKEEKGLDKLLSYMGCGRDKDRIVNFRALLGGKDGKRPKTVEFRQHAGTLDVQEVGWWVRFCLGLVQLAWRYGVEGQVGKMKSWEDKIDIEDLWEAMGFQEEGREFYRKRREQWGMVVMPGDVVVWTADVDEPISEEEDEEFWRRLESEAGSMSSAEEEDAAR